VLDLFATRRYGARRLSRKRFCSVYAALRAGGAQKTIRRASNCFKLAPEEKARADSAQGVRGAFKAFQCRLPNELLAEIAKLGGGSIAFGVRQGKADAIDKALRSCKNRNGAGGLSTDRHLREANSRVVSRRCSHIVREGSCRDHKRRSARCNRTRTTRSAPSRQPVAAMSPDVREVAESLLVGRVRGAALVAAVTEEGHTEVIPCDPAQLLLHRDDKMPELVRKHWAEVKGATTADAEGDRRLRWS